MITTIKTLSNYYRKLANRGILLTFLLICTEVAFPQAASAHALHDTSINRYSGLEIGAAGVRIHYVLSFDRSLTYQERVLLDANRDGQVSEAERRTYLTYKVGAIQSGLQLFINGVSTLLHLTHQELSFPPDRAGIHIVYISVDLETTPLANNARTLFYQDTNFSDRDGWKEIVIRNATGVALLGSDAPDADQSNALQIYPKRLLVIPPMLTSAHATFRLDPHIVVKSVAVSDASNGVAYLQDPLTILLNVNQVTWQILLLALGMSVVLGALHALSPGHGKTVVGAYLVSTRGTPRHAAFLGMIVTVTHTLGVYALGLLALTVSHIFLPEQMYPWLDLISSLCILLMGVALLYSRIRSSRTVHSHIEDGVHAHTHIHHEHTYETYASPHTHDGKMHSHLPPGADGHKLTWRSLLLFGISAGLTPCPSALILMLSAIALHRTVFGLVLIIFFSLGLAAMLIAIGFLFIYAHTFLFAWTRRFPGQGALLRVLPGVSAVAVIVIGWSMAYAALVQLGLL